MWTLTAAFDHQALRAADVVRALGIAESTIPESFLNSDSYHVADHCFGEKVSDLPKLPAVIKTPFWFYNDDQLDDIAGVTNTRPGPGDHVKARVQRRPPYVAVIQGSALFPGLANGVKDEKHPFVFNPLDFHYSEFEIRYLIVIVRFLCF
jgi:hypothetical protein